MTISSTIAAKHGTSSSINHGASCPSDCANGRTGSDQWDLVLGLQVAISRFVAEVNDDPKPFAWLADPNKSIVAVRRGYQVLESIH
jgi:hypothetical protein